MNRYKKILKEDRASDIQANIAIDEILKILKFYPNTYRKAYELYSIASKLVGKNPIKPYQFLSDMEKSDVLNMEKWIEIFWNSVMFNFLNVPELEDLAKEALDKKELKYKIMQVINDKKPRNLQSLIKILQNLR
jgi:hypothetical protein